MLEFSIYYQRKQSTDSIPQNCVSFLKYRNQIYMYQTVSTHMPKINTIKEMHIIFGFGSGIVP